MARPIAVASSPAVAIRRTISSDRRLGHDPHRCRTGTPIASGRCDRADRRAQRLDVRTCRRRRDHDLDRRRLGGLSRLLLLDGGARGDPPRLRLRPQGAGGAEARGDAAPVGGQRAALDRPFRSVEHGRRGHVPAGAAPLRRRRAEQRARSNACWSPRSKPASATSRPSSSSSGPAKTAAEALEGVLFETVGEA